MAPVSEFIVIEVLKEGQLRIQSLVKSFNSLPQNDLTLFDLESAFAQLVETELIMMSIDVRKDSFQDQLDIGKDNFTCTSISEPLIKELFQSAAAVKTEVADDPPAKKVKRESPDNGSSVYFSVNYEKADQMLRDALIITSLRNRFSDESTAAVAESLVRLSSKLSVPGSPMSSTVTVEAIANDLAALGLNESDVRSCLSVLVEEADSGVKAVERLAGGGLYAVDALHVLQRLVEATVASIIEQKYGARYARVFRIVLAHKAQPQKLIEENALMPPKDCKEIIFTLLRDGLIKTNYYTRTADYAPGKTHFLFSIDLEQVARRIMSTCCHAITNVITRRHFEHENNRLLIERKSHVDTLVAQLEQQEDTEQQVQDLTATFSSRDLELIASAERAFQKLQLAELQVEETLFTLQTWLQLKQRSEAIKE